MNREKILEEINKNKDWYNKSYSGYFIGIHEQALIINSEFGTNPFTLSKIVFFLNHNHKDHFDGFWDYNEMRMRREELLKKVTSDENFLTEVYDEWKPLYRHFVDACDKVSSLELAKLSDEELRNDFLNLHKALLDSCRWSYTVDILLSNEAEDWLTVKIKKEIGDKDTSKNIEILTHPTRASFVEEANLAILKIAKLLKDARKDEAQENAQNFVKNYFWFRTNYKSFRRFSVGDVIDEAKNETSVDLEEKITHLEEKTKLENEKKQELFNTLKISNRLKQIIRLSELFTYFQDKRKEKVLRMNTLFYEFLDEVSKRFEISTPLQFYMTTDEVFALFDGKRIDKEVLRDRYENGFVIIYHKWGYFILNKDEYNLIDVNNFFPENDNIESFKGSIAYKGKVKGIARILKTVEDIKSFEEGQILVANQTTPEFVPAMKKAIAIITDQGGITCHAAIVSRELKLPAIIGTKIATKVLKDGDLVEVNANTGVVTILKNN